MTDKDDSRRTPVGTYVAVALLTAALGFGAVYALRPATDTTTSGAKTAGATALRPTTSGSMTVGEAAKAAPTGGSQASGAAAAARAALSTGEMLTFVFRLVPEPVPDIAFEDATGAKKTLGDWKGKYVLLNLWATWCAPCRHEMPSLDRLQKKLGGATFEVVALSVDRQGAGPSKKFLDDIRIEKLALYVDSTSKSLGGLKATGLPTTILIGPDGREIGRLAGPAEWDSADAVRLIEAVMKGG